MGRTNDFRGNRSGGPRDSRSYAGRNAPGGSRNSGRSDDRRAPDVTMMKVDLNQLNAHNYVDLANEVMKSMLDYERAERSRSRLTTTKIRSLLTLINRAEDLARLKSGTELSEARIQDLLHAQVRFAYESGREESVKRFLEQTQLLSFLKRVIQSREKAKFELFARYFESLVAYHRFHGGREK